MVGVAQYQAKHLSEQASDKQWLVRSKTVLGQVVVNTGGTFTLKLYNGREDGALPFAIITNPPTGCTFTYECVLDNGIVYTLHGLRRVNGNPYSVTVTYATV